MYVLFCVKRKQKANYAKLSYGEITKTHPPRLMMALIMEKKNQTNTFKFNKEKLNKKHKYKGGKIYMVRP